MHKNHDIKHEMINKNEKISAETRVLSWIIQFQRHLHDKYNKLHVKINLV